MYYTKPHFLIAHFQINGLQWARESFGPQQCQTLIRDILVIQYKSCSESPTIRCKTLKTLKTLIQMASIYLGAHSLQAIYKLGSPLRFLSSVFLLLVYLNLFFFAFSFLWCVGIRFVFWFLHRKRLWGCDVDELPILWGEVFPHDYKTTNGSFWAFPLISSLIFSFTFFLVFLLCLFENHWCDDIVLWIPSCRLKNSDYNYLIYGSQITVYLVFTFLFWLFSIIFFFKPNFFFLPGTLKLAFSALFSKFKSF